MKVDVRKRDDVIIVDLDGPLVSGLGDEVLGKVMNQLVAEDWKKILLNLTRVSKVDSCGIGELVAGVKLAERFGSMVKTVNMSKQVRDVLDLTKILPLLDLHSSEKEALAAFAEAGPAQESGTD